MVLVMLVRSWVGLEADVVKDLERGQVTVVSDPLAGGGLIEVEVDVVKVSLGDIKQVVALVSAAAPAAVR